MRTLQALVQLQIDDDEFNEDFDMFTRYVLGASGKQKTDNCLAPLPMTSSKPRRADRGLAR